MISPHRLLTALVLMSAFAEQGCSRPGRPQSGVLSPATVVLMLYHDHFAHGQRWDSTYVRRREFFSHDLAALLDADTHAAAANPNEIVGLDFDPLTDAQDSMTSFAVTGAHPAGAESLVTVTIRQDTAAYPVHVRLTKTPNGWRVANIEYREGDLVSILRELAAERAKGKR